MSFQPRTYVGFDLVQRQRERKWLRRGFHFNVMLVGQSALGKSTLLNTLMAAHLVDPPKHAPASTTDIRVASFAIEEKGTRLALSVIDTPGFGDAVNNEAAVEPITRYIKDQYAAHLRKELAPTRDPYFPDTRVHCLLYFIAPSGHALKPLDVVVMKKLGEYCNVVPVIAKSDTMTLDERAAFKRRIQKELAFHEVRVFPSSLPNWMLDQDDLELHETIQQMVPFAVVGSERYHTINGKQFLGRLNRSGFVNVEDPTHCEFVHLRNFLIRTHLDTLIESTCAYHYENFRTKQLMALKEGKK